MRIKTTGPVPLKARPLLAELKARKAEAITCLQSREPFDHEAAQQYFAGVLARLSEQYPFGAIDWAQLHRPELWQSCLEALAQVEAAFRDQDMAAVKRAVDKFERANSELFATYPGLPWRPGQEGGGGRTWQLTDNQAAELEGLFATPGVVERRGAKWYSPEAWEQG